MRPLVNHIARFFGLILLQGLIIDNIDLGPNIYPMTYLLFLILLPAETPSWGVMILGFLMGLGIDTFNSTLGLHISACVLIAFARPLILRLLSPRDGYEPGQSFGLNTMGIKWMLYFTFIFTFCHHLFFFFMESFHFNNIEITLGRTLLSSFASTASIILLLYLFRHKARNI